MNKEFIPYEQALALKELGFDEPCLAYYQKSAVIGDATILPIQIRNKASNFNNNEYSKMGVPFCSAPLYQQAFRWFREKYGLKHDIDDDNVGTKFYYKIRSYTDKFDNYDDIIKSMREEKDWAKIEFKTYEEAELKCLIKLIEIVKNK